MAGVLSGFVSCALVFQARGLFSKEYGLQTSSRATRNITKFRASYTHCPNLAWSVSSSTEEFDLSLSFSVETMRVLQSR